MSRLLSFVAAAVLVGGLFVLNPGPAQAQRHGGFHGGGWHGGGWHGGGWRGGGWHGGGWRGRGWGGWGWGPAIGLGIGVGSGWGWGYPYGYYAAGPWDVGPSCGWVRVRTWRHGFWVVRRAWRCW